MNSPDHSTKGTPSRRCLRRRTQHSAPTACRYRGSGSLSSPSRGAFHLSLTVLVHYRWLGVFSLGGWSPQLPAGLLVSRGTQEQRPHSRHPVAYGTLTPSGVASQQLRLTGAYSAGCVAALQPRTIPSRRCRGLGSSRFARHYYGNLKRLISSPVGTEMFQFPTCPSRGLCIQPPMQALARLRVAPFGSDRLIARLQLPGHVSPLSAPFVGTQPLRHPPCTLPRLATIPLSGTEYQAP